MISGVARRTGIDTAMNIVCICASKLVKNNVNVVAPAPNPKSMVKTVPAQVGHPTKSPVIAPNAPSFPPLFAMEKTVADIAKFRPTRNDTVTSSNKFNGIICKPTCSVKNANIIGIYPGRSQHGESSMCGGFGNP
jgi:hypothetical protein